MFKTIGIVVGSYVLSVILVICTDPLLTRLFPGDFVRGRIPSNNALMASTAFFVVISVFCSWVCARFSAATAARTVLGFFALGEAMGVVATILNWGNGWPHWYGLSWLIVWPVGCWIGLLLGRSRANQAAAVGI